MRALRRSLRVEQKPEHSGSRSRAATISICDEIPSLQQQQHHQATSRARSPVAADGSPPRSTKRLRKSLSVKRLMCAPWCRGGGGETPAAWAETAPSPDVPRLAARLLHEGAISGDEYADILAADDAYRASALAAGAADPARAPLPPALPRYHSRACAGPRRCSRVQAAVAVTDLPVASRTRAAAAAANAAANAAAAAAAAAQLRKQQQLRDPITLEDLGSWTWGFVHATTTTAAAAAAAAAATCAPADGTAPALSSGGGTSKQQQHCTLYNVESLVHYLLHSGEFCEPITRIPFSLRQVVELEGVALQAGVKMSDSLVDAWRMRNAPGGRYKLEKERREMLLGCDRCLGEIVSEMLAAVESTDPEEGQLQLVLLFPQFSQMFHSLWAADSAFARQCLSHYMLALAGPPNRPTRDHSGMLAAALNYLREAAPHALADASSSGAPAQLPLRPDE